MLLMKFTPLASAFWGIVAVVLVGALRSSSRLGWREILAALDEGARGSLGVAMACALVGFVVGASSLTSLGLNLSNNIIHLSGGNLFFMLVLSMIACLVLGMGLPTTANYIVCSTIIAPALVKLGALPLAAHLFVFYFGIMADLTPPVCLAAFTGAGIAGADPTRTGIQATTMALVAYLLPYSFVYTPMILLQDVAPLPLGILVVASVLGVLGLASAGRGWMFRTLGGVERIVALALGVGAFWPHPVVKIAAALGLVSFLFLERLAARRAAERSVQGA
jgi:TRAP transporter 4TM/12TM fusion protein